MLGIERPKVRSITSIGGGRGDIFVVTVPKDAKVAGKTVQDVVASRSFPAECVFIARYNRETDEFSIPRSPGVINEGDELFLISPAADIKKASDFLTAAK